jgi:hypothetical protein
MKSTTARRIEGEPLLLTRRATPFEAKVGGKVRTYREETPEWANGTEVAEVPLTPTSLIVRIGVLS